MARSMVLRFCLFWWLLNTKCASQSKKGGIYQLDSETPIRFHKDAKMTPLSCAQKLLATDSKRSFAYDGKRCLDIDSQNRVNHDLAKNSKDKQNKNGLDGVQIWRNVGVTSCYHWAKLFPDLASGVRRIHTEMAEFDVFCEIDNSQGWIVIQKRFDGSVDFDRSWTEYRQGFGNLNSEFWLGLDKIADLTKNNESKLRIKFSTFAGKEYIVEYSHFRVMDESRDYKLDIGGFSVLGPISIRDSLSTQNNGKFATLDRNHEANACKLKFSGGWWITNQCVNSFLNGMYKGSKNGTFDERNGTYWFRNNDHTVKPNYGAISKTMMMIQ